MRLRFIGRKIITKRNMTVHSLAEVDRKMSSTFPLEISSDAKYLQVLIPTISYRISTYLLSNSFPQSDLSIRFPDPPQDYPLTTEDIIEVDRGKSLPIKDRTDISGLLTLSGKEPLHFTPTGVYTP